MKFFSTYTNKIILANVLVFFLMLSLSGIFSYDFLLSILGLQPAALFAGQRLWTIITSIFVHANFTHLFVNMFSLFFIGTFVEKLIGKKRFLAFYLISGIFAGLFFCALSYYFGFGFLGERVFGGPQIFGVGASGAIFGLLGLLAVLTPKNRVFLIAGPMIAIVLQVLIDSLINSSAISTILNFIVTVYIVMSIFFMISFNPQKRRFALPIEIPFWALPIIAIVPLVLIGLIVPMPIGNMAHLGGLVAGLIYGYYLVKKYPHKAALISRMFSK